jgi:hypothetical protein
MKKMNEKEALVRRIALLQVRQTEELHLLKNQFQDVYESFKPWQILKNTLYDVVVLSKSKKGIANSAFELVRSYLCQKSVSNALTRKT